jgi:hypothetical protein
MKRLWLAILFMTVFMTAFIPVRSDALDLRYTAEVHPLDDRSKLLYTYRSESEPQGDLILVHNQFSYPDGHMATHEDLTFTKSGHLTLYKQEHAQLKATGSIEIGGGKAKFTWKKDGKEKTASEDAGDDFIVGTQIPMELEAHWAEILKGDTLKRRLAVLERLETIGFGFTKEGDGVSDSKKAIVVKMKASAFLIAALVPPLHFYMSPDGKVLYEIKGRTTVKKDSGNGKFGDLDADVVYTKGPAPEIQPTGGNSK